MTALLDPVRSSIVLGAPTTRWPDLESPRFVEWALRQLDWSNVEAARYFEVSDRMVQHWLAGTRLVSRGVERELKLLVLSKEMMEVFCAYRDSPRKIR